MTIDVTVQNDPPTGGNDDVTTLEDTQYVFQTSDFTFADVDSGTAQSEFTSAMGNMFTTTVAYNYLAESANQNPWFAHKHHKVH